MNSWYTTPAEGYRRPEMKCGTTACALGWMALDPWFRRRGLALKVRKTSIEDAIDLGDEFQGTIYYRKHEAEVAAACFFGISYDDARELFIDSMYLYCSGYPSPRDIAKLIRHYVATGRVEVC